MLQRPLQIPAFFNCNVCDELSIRVDYGARLVLNPVPRDDSSISCFPVGLYAISCHKRPQICPCAQDFGDLDWFRPLRTLKCYTPRVIRVRSTQPWFSIPRQCVQNQSTQRHRYASVPVPSFDQNTLNHSINDRVSLHTLHFPHPPHFNRGAGPVFATRAIATRRALDADSPF